LKTDRYKEAGVDIQSGDELVERIKGLAASTFTGGELGGIGGFGGFFSLDLKGLREPVLVSSTDGVGTKLKIALMCRKFDTVGIDLVAMCVNDILTSGAKPLFFLDYFAAGKIGLDMGEAVVRGVAEGCRQAGCSLIGGETAEMPGVYPGEEFDLAGFCVGIADRKKIIDGGNISPGDLIAGLPSSGIHSNGYSLARKVFFEEKGLSVRDVVSALGCSVGEELLKPTVIYAKQLEGFAGIEIRGMAHITGGGWFGNVKRILPEGCSAVFEAGGWDVPPVFSFLEKEGRISRDEMFSVFNMGIGFMLVVPESERTKIPASAEIIGRIERGRGEVKIL
jgi:phosphoribosylformylglycinamidine cyclo-ligase